MFYSFILKNDFIRYQTFCSVFTGVPVVLPWVLFERRHADVESPCVVYGYLFLLWYKTTSSKLHPESSWAI